MLEVVNSSDHSDAIARYFARAVQSARHVYVGGVQVSKDTFRANQFKFDRREFHLSNRVVIPPKVAAGGLDELIAYPRSKDALMIRIGCSDPIDIDPKKWRWQDHVQTTVSHDPERGTIVYHTIAFPKAIYKPYYEGMVNGFLWPLNHQRLDIAKQPYVTGLFDAAGREIYDRNRFRKEAEATEFVNEVFAEFVAERIVPTESDTGIVHDPHLFETGQFLRDKHVDCPLAFYLHTPAPSYDLYRQLPRHQQEHVRKVLLSLYAYDLVGAQSATDLRNIWKIVGDGSSPIDPVFDQPYSMTRKDIRRVHGNLDCHLWSTSIGVLPVVGHNELYAAQAAANENRLAAEEFLYKSGFAKPNMFTWGRLDYSKGLVNQTRGLNYAINKLGLPANDVRFLQQAAYGRRGVKAYQQENEKLKTANRRIMAKYGPTGFQERLYRKELKRPTCLALARMTGESEEGQGGIVLATSLADGHCLTADETYFAFNPENPGSLILGIDTGAAPIIGDAALLVNASEPKEIARAMARGWWMPHRERVFRHQTGLERINKRSNIHWQNSLIDGARGCWEQSRSRSRTSFYPSVALADLRR